MKCVFIGGGAMATALIGGMLRSGKEVSDIKVVDPDETQRSRLTTAFPKIQCYVGLESAIFDGVDVVVLAIKPQQLQAVARQLVPFTPIIPVVLSIAAGVRIKDISRWLGDYPTVIRAMPNTPAQVNAGTIGIYAAPDTNETARNQVNELLESVGNVFWVLCEDTLEKVTAIFGSGPAYVFYFLECLEAAGRSMGLEEPEARAAALDILSGGLALVRHNPAPFAELRAQVTSKRGTTESAMQVLDRAEVRKAFQEAIHAARQRAKELGDELGVDNPADSPTHGSG
ncbi:MAG: pyrroline-5-carboxylate reductase [Burkholderiales bacterium]|jgi:pyrroline-5-carboxylate reductase|nr:pyrroline-5-carboxylate reductase [Burkholderiales bacterium]